MLPSDPRRPNTDRRQEILDLLEKLPEMVKQQVALKLDDEVASLKQQFESLKEYYSGLEKTNIELLKWRNTGQVVHRDELVGMRWAADMLDLNNSDNSASFEKLIATCMWASKAFSSATRQDNVNRFLGEYNILK